MDYSQVYDEVFKNVHTIYALYYRKSEENWSLRSMVMLSRHQTKQLGIILTKKHGLFLGNQRCNLQLLSTCGAEDILVTYRWEFVSWTITICTGVGDFEDTKQ